MSFDVQNLVDIALYGKDFQLEFSSGKTVFFSDIPLAQLSAIFQAQENQTHLETNIYYLQLRQAVQHLLSLDNTFSSDKRAFFEQHFGRYIQEEQGAFTVPVFVQGAGGGDLLEVPLKISLN